MARKASTLPEIIEDSTKTAIIIPGGERLSFQTYKSEFEAFGKEAAKNGVAFGACVSISLINNLEFLVAFLGLTFIGAKVAPLNPAYTEDEFKFYLQDTESKVLIVAKSSEEKYPAREAAKKLGVEIWEVELEGHHVKLIVNGKHEEQPVKQPAPSDVALFLHTSGTTSRPKGVPLTHLNLVTSLENIIKTYELSDKDTSLIVMPLFHVHGLLGATLSTLYSGGTVVVPPRFSATSFWKDVLENNVTWYSAVPTIHQILLQRADDDKAPTGKLRFIRSCSSSLAPVILERLETRFGAPVLEAYGMTEASHQMASNPLPPENRKPGSVGKGTNVQIAILDDSGKPVSTGGAGEVCIKGKNVTLGYHNNPTANKENWTSDGWFRTGDQGILDEEGYLTLTGRIKELINRGGEKISPLELDAVLLQHPSVEEVVTFAMPDEKYGEEVAAALVPKKEARASKSDEELSKELIEYCKQKLAPFKAPKKIFVADVLPKTATGKIQRRHVAAHFLQKK